jgi:hypothetical protein
VEFDQPQAISRLVYEVEEAVRERTQEVRMESLRMEVERTAKSWFKSTPSAPGGATYQREEQHLNLLQARTSSRLAISVWTIVPNKNGSGTETLTALRLFA